MRILLVWPQGRTETEWGGDLGAISEPLALEYLASAALAKGHEVRVHDARLHPGRLPEELAAFRPELVGVTAYSMHVSAALAVCRQARDLVPGCRTVVGGHHATFLPEDFFDDAVDFVVSGEGVLPFSALLDRLASGRPADGIGGLWARAGGTGFVLGGPQAPFDVDALPLPDRTVTAADRGRYFIDWMRPVALLRSTVGCPFRCSFCSLWQLMGGRYYVRSPQAVADELATIREEFVFLVDDEAFINGHRMRELARVIAERGIRKRFFAYCRIDSLLRNREAVAAWRDIGLERLFVGIDAITEKDLGEFRKKTRLAQIEDGLGLARDLGVEIFAQFIVNTDYTRRDFERLARFVEHHTIRYPSFTVLTPLPGTELLRSFDHVVARGPGGRPDWDLFDCQHAVTATRLPPDEFRAAYRGLYGRFRNRYARYRRFHEITEPTTDGIRLDRSGTR